jgi:hypothetical protein
MPRPRIIAPIVALLGAAVFAPISIAQMRGPGFGHSVVVGSFTGRPHSHSFGPGAIFIGDPFYADYPAAPLTIPPQFVVVQPAPTADTPPETKSEPLMIELQGNRYVRFGGRQQSAELNTNAPPDYAEAGKSPQITQYPAQAELPPTILIFRDGHREQAPEYAIVGSTIYAKADYWQTGQWTKNIQLSALNIPETVKANRSNGVKFTLPSAPNEVITRP